MSADRLAAELRRLYLLPQGDGAPALRGPAGEIRAPVLALGRPADWAALAQLWRGVQLDLQWPAPAIAVSGEGLQLWFSLQQPLPAERAAALLAGLQARYLAEVEPHRVQCLPALTAPDACAPLVPAPLALPEQWSAFVAPDLAPVFADTPWLDIPPSPEGQAELLASLHSITPAALDAAWPRLPLAAAPVTPEPAALRPSGSGEETDPRRFLLRVMNDEGVPLALRIEAAKALLPR
ncbi:MAG: hypothetical protein E6Q67_05205 [Roseateles sp.]|nr:MAG: hypothetical protein E6Q67_05205 [Roseateles sp.]